MKVQIISRKILKPTIPTPQHLQTCRLSFFDQMAPKVYTPYNYFYSVGKDGDIFKNARRLEEMEKSLSNTLSRFYPLAGRLAANGDSIDCRDQGIQYLKSQVNSTLNEFICQGTKNSKLFNHILPLDIKAPTSPTTPLLAIQITTFLCGGLALAVLPSHIIFDAFNSCIFINEWAKACRQGTSEVILPVFNLASIFPPRNAPEEVVEPDRILKTEAKIMTKIFRFDEAAILALKSKVMANASATKGTPTRVQVVTATIWKALIRGAQARNGGHPRAATITVALKLHGRSSLVAGNRLGNFFLPIAIKFVPTHKHIELHDLVDCLRDNVQKVAECCAEAKTGDELVSIRAKSIKEILEDTYNDQVDVWRSSSLCKFPFYNADFGWGKPLWVTSASDDFEIFSLWDTGCGTGIEALVTLNEIEMLALERDPDIIKLTSSSYISSKL